jgi:predicted alpha/beta-hydrolase family hydrolase
LTRFESKDDVVDAQPIAIHVQDGVDVSGLLLRPSGARILFVMAHGAGAGMTHPSMDNVATALAERGIATLRFQFPFMQEGTKRPDHPPLAHATVRAAVIEARRLVSDLPLIAGGRSFGGRMTSQAQALSPLPGVLGLVFLAFPLHPPRRPSDARGKHLFQVEIPMLFIQGTRDELATLEYLERLCTELDARATLKLFEHVDHAFHVRARSGRTDAQVRGDMLDAFEAWVDGVLASSRIAPEGDL